MKLNWSESINFNDLDNFKIYEINEEDLSVYLITYESNSIDLDEFFIKSVRKCLDDKDDLNELAASLNTDLVELDINDSVKVINSWLNAVASTKESSKLKEKIFEQPLLKNYFIEDKKSFFSIISITSSQIQNFIAIY